MSFRTFVTLLIAVVVRPRLWLTAIRQAVRLAPRRWWATAPFLPVPTRAYLDFRLTTQYGTSDQDPYIYDIIEFLEWSRDWHSTTRSNGRRQG